MAVPLSRECRSAAARYHFNIICPPEVDWWRLFCFSTIDSSHLASILTVLGSSLKLRVLARFVVPTDQVVAGSLRCAEHVMRAVYVYPLIYCGDDDRCLVNAAAAVTSSLINNRTPRHVSDNIEQIIAGLNAVSLADGELVVQSGLTNRWAWIFWHQWPPR